MIENDTEVKHVGIRASNTVKTLTPTEVVPGVQTTPDPFYTTITVPSSGKYAFEYDSPVSSSTGMYPSPDNAVLIDPLKSTENESPEQQQTLFGLPEGDFESGFADDHCFAYTPDKEESVLSRRVSRLEEQVDGILDRLAKFSIRASHKI